MVVKLYGIYASSAVRSVLMCADVLNLVFEFVPINLVEEEQLKEEFRKKNPAHTIPLLEEEDGFVLGDSHAIITYLVSKYGTDDSLYPKDNLRKRAIIDNRLHFDSSVLFIRGLLINRPFFFQQVAPTQEKLDKLKEAYEIVERYLENSKFIAGNELTVADFSYISSLTTWDYLLTLKDFPNIVKYLERVKQFPFYEKNAEGLKQYAVFYAEALKRIGK